MVTQKKVLISGGGIAGLTLAILLKQGGWEPTVVEKSPSLREEGYMMDFYGSGWDVATRMGLEDDILKVKYPIFGFMRVNANGSPFAQMPIKWVQKAVNGKYAYLRRQDLERVLHEQASKDDVRVLFGTQVQKIADLENHVEVTLDGGSKDTFHAVIGADGAYSHVRTLVFGQYQEYAQHLGYYVAAFHTKKRSEIGDSFRMYEEVDRSAGFYPTSNDTMDTLFVFREKDVGFIPPDERVAFLKAHYKNMGWIVPDVLEGLQDHQPIFLDPVTQIVMPTWHKGRVALLGDAAYCLTLLSGQGSHMAMTGAFQLAELLLKNPSNPQLAFKEYEAQLRPSILKKQKEAKTLANIFVPSKDSRFWVRRLVAKVMLTRLGIKLAMSSYGAKSIVG